MHAFESVKQILDFMELLAPADPNNRWTHYIKNVLISLPMLLLLCSLCAFFVLHLDNLVEATDVFYVIAATLLCIGQYWFLVGQKVPLVHLLNDLQQLVDQREFSPHANVRWSIAPFSVRIIHSRVLHFRRRT